MTTEELMSKVDRIRELDHPSTRAEGSAARHKRERETVKLARGVAAALDGKQFTITLGPAFDLDKVRRQA